MGKGVTAKERTISPEKFKLGGGGKIQRQTS